MTKSWRVGEVITGRRRGTMMKEWLGIKKGSRRKWWARAGQGGRSVATK